MKEKLNNFYQAHKYTILWTIAYVVATYLILKLMFNFSIFSAANWTRLMHARLYGFAGFVFGILILAAVPLYVATTVIVERTKQPLFTISIPNFVKNLFATPPQPTAPTDEPAPESEPDAPAPEPTIDNGTPLPEGMPTEMRGPYVRARKYGSAFAIAQKPAPQPAMATTATQPTATSDARPGDIPIPTDFDFDTSDMDNADFDAAPSFDVPVFNDINFDTPTEDTAPEIQIPNVTDTADGYNADVIAHLTISGRDARTENGIVISGDAAIASHTDNEFWIADEPNWFAPGQTRPSPIGALVAAADTGLRPILYLGATNIMDLDAKRAEWESAGITVITNLNDI